MTKARLSSGAMQSATPTPVCPEDPFGVGLPGLV